MAAYEICDFVSGFEGSSLGKGVLFGHTQTVKVGGQLSEEVRVTSVVLQESVLVPLLFLLTLIIFGGTLNELLEFSLMIV